MIRLRRVSLTIILAMAVSPNTAAAQDNGWRTIEIETTEVTAPDVAITPDVFDYAGWMAGGWTDPRVPAFLAKHAGR